jgi:hypothetical protein
VVARPDCASLSRGHLEPLLGTASRVRSWLLVEQDGIWGHNALSESDLEASVAEELKTSAARHGIRVLLIRRNGAPARLPRRGFAVHSGMRAGWIQAFSFEHPRALLDVDLEAVAAARRPPVGAPWDGPLYLVCTNGKRDPCCETYGRPVAARLTEARAGRTWESSHVGGDRFAGNLVCLPHGLYFGRLDADDVVQVAASYERGIIELPHFRGRSCYEPVVQAGDVLIRSRTGLDGIDDLLPESRRDHGGGASTLVFRDGRGIRHSIRVAVRRAERRRLTCSSEHPGAPREFVADP